VGIIFLYVRTRHAVGMTELEDRQITLKSILMGDLDRLCYLQHSKLGCFHFTESVFEYKLT
jgi:hypothetical protein